ncbi:solute carrier family 27, variant [Blastomyces gilchristii SLH14081]|uniref:Solute carrier family 27, variant n=1 Tax=Blastomyces gilchristii (strain SLH14081) TaxID=559298 RepID=A0A179U7N6_BLAGS|nr:solute carrier family 27, variant [Blastomyces gilchristii SLH14081]OAT03984.1 solute carrier family 27, variant [Blastomyces gilchristii SLH14081]
MDAITSHPLASLFAITAVVSYLNAKFAIGSDLRDIRHARDFARRKQRRVACAKRTHSLYEILEQSGAGDGDDAIWFESKTKSYGQLKKGMLVFSNISYQFSFCYPISRLVETAPKVDQLAGLLHARSIKTGDVVAVFMTNSPEMVVTILALSKLGAVASLINTNLRNDTLIYALDRSKPIYILSTPDLAQHVKADLPHISLDLSSFTLTAENPVPPNIELIRFNDLQNASYVDLIPANRSLIDMAALIYTSGTTGKPKACMSETLQDTTRSGHTPHSPLPLFHGTAFLAGLCYNLGSAGTLCLARKFSASSFWKDATECRANRILYVGELCRYLLATPTSSYDRSHSVTHAFGNGLRADVWEKFRQHFGIEEIREIYRATEGIAKFDNHGRSAAGAGKIGFAGPIKRYLEDVTFVVKYDPETQMPVRDPKTGFCIKADLGEEGEVIGRVLNLKLLSNYLNDDAATEKKLLRDVFRKGDLYQRMGDLVIHEESWWVRFQERVGDTFRWKGENLLWHSWRSDHCLTLTHGSVRR